MQSWFYENTGKYGSPEHDRRNEVVGGVRIAPNRKSVVVRLRDFGEGEKWIDRIYHIHLPDTAGLFGEAPVKKELLVYFTLRAIP